jgi:hypothetical protein
MQGDNELLAKRFLFANAETRMVIVNALGDDVKRHAAFYAFLLLHGDKEDRNAYRELVINDAVRQ